jgi:hypothetical protein
MSSIANYFQPLTYKQYMPAMIGIWLIAFAVGIWLGESVVAFALPAFVIGLVVHGISMHKAHKQSH